MKENETVADSKTPLFSVNAEIFEVIMRYDVHNFTDNYFINAICK